MNRAELRQRIRDLVAWDTLDADTTAQAALDRSVRYGFDQAVTECPEAFEVAVQRVRIPGSAKVPAGATLDTTADSWVMRFTGTTFVPKTDRTWDGTMWLEIADSTSGRTLRFQARTFWSTVSAGVTSYYVALDRPWPLSAATGLSYQLIAQYVWMPMSWQRVVSAMRWGDTGGPMSLVTNANAVALGQTRNLVSSVGGYPTELRRERSYQQPAPNLAPDGEVNDGTWTDLEPVGSFKYCFTYCWGYRDPLDKSPGGSFIPLYESSPSPVSAELIVPDMTRVVDLKLPDIDFQMGFHTTGTLRSTHSGVYKRIYRARLTTGIGTNSAIEAPDVYQFLADVDGSDTSFTDDGTIIPDYTLRLPESSGYYGWTMWPTPSSDTEIDLNVIERPPLLLNDYDAILVKPEYSDIVAHFCAAVHAAGRDADSSRGSELLAEARARLMRLRSAAANPTGRVQRLGFDRHPAPQPWRYRGT